jgi:hypothetical protein
VLDLLGGGLSGFVSTNVGLQAKMGDDRFGNLGRRQGRPSVVQMCHPNDAWGVAPSPFNVEGRQPPVKPPYRDWFRSYPNGAPRLSSLV